MEFIKYHKIKILGDKENQDIFSNPEDEIIIEEKIDGGNFRFMINEGKLIVGSRTQELRDDVEHKFQKNFQRCINEIKKRFYDADIDLMRHSKGKIFYGECCTPHSMPYDWEKIPVFLGFDIFDIQSGNYLLNKNKRNLFNSWNLTVVPLIKVIKAKEIIKIDDSFVPKSVYAVKDGTEDTQKAEGIVFKNYDKQLFAKYVREKFKEKNREVFGGNKKYAKTDDEYFSLAYCTNARIDKCIFKLIDEGKELDMTLMGDLLNMVYKDIWEEHWNEIAFSKKRIDLLNLKRLVSKRCLIVLKQVIANNAFKP